MKNIIGDVINCRYSGVFFATNTRFMPRKTEKKNTLDAFDRAILRILQDDNKTPQRTISEAVNLSAAAVQRRISALENAGVIARNSAVVNPDTIPLTITAIVELQLRDERAMTVDAAKTIFRNAPEVQQCYYVTGGTSFILIIVTSDMRTYEALTRQLFATNDLVASYRTLIALDKVKTGTGIFIPE